MRYGSVCSGIEAASVAWSALEWEPAWFSEIEPFPCTVLDRHYPKVPNLGDITSEDFIERVKGEGLIDALVGGTPCQSFSVAGLRRGLDDDRGNLSLRFMQLVDALRPRWIVWENVPGVLSANEGRDFGAILGALEECGYGWAYRVLDAQYFGVAQRRRRVFVVGHLGSWGPAGEVLSVRESLQGHPAPRREARQDVAITLTRGADSSGKGGYAGRRREDDVNLVSNTLGSRTGGFRQNTDESLVPEVAGTLKGRHDSGQGEGTPVIAFDSTQITHPENRSKVDDRAPHLTESGHAPAVAGFSLFQSSASATVGYGEERSPTLKGAAATWCRAFRNG